MDGNSFVKNGIRKAEDVVVIQHKVIEVKALTPNMLIQKAELIAFDKSIMSLTG